MRSCTTIPEIDAFLDRLSLAQAPHAFVQRAVAQRAEVVDERRPGGTRRVQIQQVLGEVEARGRRGDDQPRGSR